MGCTRTVPFGAVNAAGSHRTRRVGELWGLNGKEGDESVADAGMDGDARWTERAAERGGSEVDDRIVSTSPLVRRDGSSPTVQSLHVSGCEWAKDSGLEKNGGEHELCVAIKATNLRWCFRQKHGGFTARLAGAASLERRVGEWWARRAGKFTDVDRRRHRGCRPQPAAMDGVELSSAAFDLLSYGDAGPRRQHRGDRHTGQPGETGGLHGRRCAALQLEASVLHPRARDGGGDVLRETGRSSRRAPEPERGGRVVVQLGEVRRRLATRRAASVCRRCSGVSSLLTGVVRLAGHQSRWLRAPGRGQLGNEPCQWRVECARTVSILRQNTRPPRGRAGDLRVL